MPGGHVRQGGGRQGEAFRRAIRTAQETDLVPVGITLDRELAQKLTKVCAQKHVLRDEFVEMTLVVFGKALECAATYISNPGADGAIEYQNEYDHLAMSDDEANSMISKILQAAETQRKD